MKFGIKRSGGTLACWFSARPPLFDTHTATKPWLIRLQ